MALRKVNVASYGAPGVEQFAGLNGFFPTLEIDDQTGQLYLSGVALPNINNQSGSYQLGLLDGNGYIRMNSASANNLTVPADSNTLTFPVGTVITVRQIGAGQTTVVAAGGVTITSPSTLALRAQYSTVQLIKVAPNTWDLAGDVA